MQVKARLQAGQAGVPVTADSIAQLETLQQLFIARDGRLLSTLAQKMAAAGQCPGCCAVQGRHTGKQEADHHAHCWLSLCGPDSAAPTASGAQTCAASGGFRRGCSPFGRGSFSLHMVPAAGAKEDTFDVWMKQESDTVQVTPLLHIGDDTCL